MTRAPSLRASRRGTPATVAPAPSSPGRRGPGPNLAERARGGSIFLFLAVPGRWSQFGAGPHWCTWHFFTRFRISSRGLLGWSARREITNVSVALTRSVKPLVCLLLLGHCQRTRDAPSPLRVGGSSSSHARKHEVEGAPRLRHWVTVMRHSRVCCSGRRKTASQYSYKRCGRESYLESDTAKQLHAVVECMTNG